MEQVGKPAPRTKTSTKPKPRPSKPKDSLPLASSYTTVANYAQAPGTVGPAVNLGPAPAKPRPKPHKKPKPTTSGHDSSSSVDQPLAAVRPTTKVPHRPATTAYQPSTTSAPRPSNSKARPPPFINQPVSFAAPAGPSTYATTAPTSSALNIAPRTSDTVTALQHAARLQSAAQARPAVNPVRPMPVIQPPAVPRMAVPVASNPPAPAPMQNPAPALSSSSVATTSAPTNKRPATGEPEETRKKAKFSRCYICDQKPGRLPSGCLFI